MISDKGKNFYLSLVVLSSFLRRRPNEHHSIFPVERRLLEEAVGDLEKIVKAARWLADCGTKIITPVPEVVWKFFELSQVTLKVLGGKMDSVEFVAAKVAEFCSNGALEEGDKQKLISLLNSLEREFNPYRSYQFERVEVLLPMAG